MEKGFKTPWVYIDNSIPTEAFFFVSAPGVGENNEQAPLVFAYSDPDTIENNRIDSHLDSGAISFSILHLATHGAVDCSAARWELKENSLLKYTPFDSSTLRLGFGITLCSGSNKVSSLEYKIAEWKLPVEKSSYANPMVYFWSLADSSEGFKFYSKARDSHKEHVNIINEIFNTKAWDKFFVERTEGVQEIINTVNSLAEYPAPDLSPDIRHYTYRVFHQLKTDLYLKIGSQITLGVPASTSDTLRYRIGENNVWQVFDPSMARIPVEAEGYLEFRIDGREPGNTSILPVRVMLCPR